MIQGKNIRGIEQIRRILKEDDKLFDQIRSEYYSRKCREFCTEYHIGVTAALRLFGRKRIEKEIYNSELEEVNKYKIMVHKNEEEIKEIKKGIPMPLDLDDYYAKRQYYFK